MLIAKIVYRTQKRLLAESIFSRLLNSTITPLFSTTCSIIPTYLWITLTTRSPVKILSIGKYLAVTHVLTQIQIVEIGMEPIDWENDLRVRVQH
jgi:hypothetical protein